MTSSIRDESVLNSQLSSWLMRERKQPLKTHENKVLIMKSSGTDDLSILGEKQ